MQIWFYFREAEVGDLVFHDGTYSNVRNRNKTVVGVCFYVDPSDNSRRLMVSSEDLATSMPYGFCNNASYSPFPTLQDSPGYNATSVPLTAYANSGLNGVHAVNDDCRDADNPDGFKIFEPTVACSEFGFVTLLEDLTYRGMTWPKDTIIPKGFYNTIITIKHRDKILSDSAVNLEAPIATTRETEMECLNRLMTEIVSKNNNQTKYNQFYYPAASLCHAFEPNTAQPLAERLKAGNWFLPAAGDLMRIVWHYYKGDTKVFKNWISEGVIRDFYSPSTGASYWSSTRAADANFYFWGGCPKVGNLYKSNNFTTQYVRPICAF